MKCCVMLTSFKCFPIDATPVYDMLQPESLTHLVASCLYWFKITICITEKVKLGQFRLLVDLKTKCFQSEQCCQSLLLDYVKGIGFRL